MYTPTPPKIWSYTVLMTFMAKDCDLCQPYCLCLRMMDTTPSKNLLCRSPVDVLGLLIHPCQLTRPPDYPVGVDDPPSM